MTTPVQADATVEEVQARAEQLGLSWQMRLGTVVLGVDPDAVLVVLDGDNAPRLTAVSMVGPLAADARVYVMAVPPAGQYVAGYAGASSPLKLTNLELAVCNTALTPLGAAPGSQVPDLSITVVVTAAATYRARAVLDFDSTVAGASVCVGELYVDGVAHSSGSQALLEVATGAERACVTQQWQGSLTAGSHTFKVFAYRTAAAGTQRANRLHSTLAVDTYE